MEIDISRPAGDYRAFERPVTLSGQRYVVRFDPAARGDGGRWWMTWRSVTGAVLARSIRLTVGPPGSDLFEFYRPRVEGLPPLALRCVAERDPGLSDLSTGKVRLLYGE